MVNNIWPKTQISC